MKSGFLTTILIFVLVNVFAQQIDFNARLDTNTITIGQQVYLHVSAANIRDDEGVIMPSWPDSISEIEVLSQSRDTIVNDGSITIIDKYLITSFDSGYVVIPPLLLFAENEEYYSEPQILNISTVELDPEQDYYDIREPIKPPFDWLYWLKRLWVLALAIAIVLAIVLWLWLRKRKEKKALEEIPDTRTPSQRARETLHEIREQRIWQDGKVKKYYSRVTDTIRTYLEESYPVSAMEMISDELLEAMQTRISADAQKILREMLLTSDMVKFAKAKPGPDQHTQLWDDAMRIIELTEPKKIDDDSAK